MPRRRRYRKRRKPARVAYAPSRRSTARRMVMASPDWPPVVNVRGRRSGYPTYLGTLANFLPKTKTMKLKYDCEFTLNAGVGQMASYIFRANSPYDPEQFIGGHSAYGFDEMMKFYQKYRVLSSKIQLWNIQPALVDAIPSYCTIVRSPDGLMFTSFADTSHLLECNARSKVKVVGQFLVANQLSQSQPATLSLTYSQRKYYPGIADLNMEGTYNTNPTKLAYFEVINAPLYGNNPDPTYYRAELTFVVKFSELIILPQSGVTSTGITNESVPVTTLGSGTNYTWTGAGGGTGPTGP